MIVRAYRALTYRGGIDADAEGQTDLADEFGIPPQTSITETRKYAYHRKIERNRTSANHGRSFMGLGVKRVIWTFASATAKLGRVLSRPIICGQLGHLRKV
jgi:5-methylcytosine-specific restriction protein A